MRNLGKVAANSRVKRVENSLLNDKPCYLFNPKGLRELFVDVGEDENGWEHVSVSVRKHPGECPTWFEMRAVKQLFWEPDEACIEWHPTEESYFHGPTGDKGLQVLHIWRPKDGDWSRLSDDGPDSTITDEQAARVAERIPEAMRRAAAIVEAVKR